MLSVESVCSTGRHKQLLIFFISGTRTSKIIFFAVFCSTSTFFLTVNGNISFGRALSRSPVTHGFFRRYFLLLFGCVLEETQGATFLEVGCEQMIADRHGNFLLRLL